MIMKDGEKMDKYLDHTRGFLKKLNKMKVTVVLIVIDALRMLLKGLKNE